MNRNRRTVRISLIIEFIESWKGDRGTEDRVDGRRRPRASMVK